MATTPQSPISDAQFNAQEASLSATDQAAQTKLENTPGYYSDTSQPSKGALVADVQARSIQQQLDALRSKKLAQDWYGPAGAEDTMVAQPAEGFVMSTLNNLAKPLYASVGAAGSILGKGPKGKNIFQAADQAVQDRATYGTLLRQFDVPPPIASTAGFAMDVILDPVNMLTLGTSGLVGKIGSGAIKAGVEGATLGAKASFLETLRHVVDMAPEFSKITGKTELKKLAEELLAKGVSETDPEYVNLIKNTLNPNATFAGRMRELALSASRKVEGAKAVVGEAAGKATTQYGEITGNTIEKILAERANRLTIGETTRELINKIPGGDKFLGAFDYDPRKWQEVSMMKDKLVNVLRESGQTIDQLGKWDPTLRRFVGGSMDSSQVKDLLQSVQDTVEKLPDDFELIANKDRSGIVKQLENMIDKAGQLGMAGPGVTRSGDLFELATRMEGEVKNEEFFNNLSTALKEMSGDTTGINFVDKGMEKLNKLKVGNVEVGKNIINTYGKFIGLFKATKLGPLSPASMVYAGVGNVAMAHMAGIDLLRPDYYKRVSQALSFLRGKDVETIGKILSEDPAIRSFVAEFPTTFAKTFGFSYNEAQARQTASLIFSEGVKTGVILPGETEKAQTAISEATRKYFEDSRAFRLQVKAQTTPFEWTYGGTRGETPESIIEGVKKEREYEKMLGAPVAPLASELSIKPYIEMKQKIAASAASGNKLAKVVDWALDQTKNYEKIDQSSRLGTFIYLTKDGLTENELRHMTGWTGFGMSAIGTRLTPADIAAKTIKNGTQYFKLQPAKAAEIVNEIYMNYAAMPAAVRTLRMLPILGSPFFSFAYAMALKTGKTAMVNPAAFNKISFFLNELEAGKSPLEKEALKSKYYSWYNQPGMINLGSTPFFNDNPIYLNVAQMIPYYSMNMFMPSERKFPSNIRGQLASAIDNVPVLKDPIGSLITDYFILPSIVRDTQPQNMWGGPLFPKSAPWYQKYIGAPIRQAAEAIVPSTAAIPMAFTPDALTPYLPSYPGRKVSYAVEGKTPVGVTAKESPASRTLRALLGIAGINLYPENLTNLTSSVKKSLKK